MYVLSHAAIDPKSGTVVSHECLAVSADLVKVQNEMSGQYEKRLSELGLKDNGAADESGESIEGGYICQDCAGIYRYADFAFGQLLETESYTISEVLSADEDTLREGKRILGKYGVPENNQEAAVRELALSILGEDADAVKKNGNKSSVAPVTFREFAEKTNWRMFYQAQVSGNVKICEDVWLTEHASAERKGCDAVLSGKNVYSGLIIW